MKNRILTVGVKLLPGQGAIIVQIADEAVALAGSVQKISGGWIGMHWQAESGIRC